MQLNGLQKVELTKMHNSEGLVLVTADLDPLVD